MPSKKKSFLYKLIFRNRLAQWLLPYELYKAFFNRMHRGMRDYLLKPAENENDNSLMGYFEKKCIFVHIPKCGGMSLAKAFFGNRGAAHLTISDYRTIFSKKEYKTFYKFTFVRNPWDRIYSAYCYLQNGGIGNSHDKNFKKTILPQYSDFNDFVVRWVSKESFYESGSLHFYPQKHFLQDCFGKINMDFVGRFENMEEDYKVVAKKLGVTTPLPHINTSEKKASYKEVYSEPAKKVVEKVYKNDIKLFGYNF